MKLECRIFDEPLLEFGDQHSHADPRLGLVDAGPLQAPLGDKIRMGVVGDAKTVESSKDFIARATRGFESKAESHPNMNPNFPGLQNANPFRCGFEIDDDACGVLTKAQIDKIRTEPHHGKAVEMAVDAIMDLLQAMDDSGNRPDVALVALPVSLIERVWNAKTDAGGTKEKEDIRLRLFLASYASPLCGMPLRPVRKRGSLPTRLDLRQRIARLISSCFPWNLTFGLTLGLGLSRQRNL